MRRPSMTTHEENVVHAFKDACARNKKADGKDVGASPSEVTALLRERGQCPELDTVIDVERTMRGLRDRGML